MLLLIAAALPWVLPASRQRSVLIHFAFFSGLWSGVSSLFWQQVAILAELYLALGLVVVWVGWKLMVAVCQVELRRRSWLWVGRVFLAMLFAAMVLSSEPMMQVEPALAWQATPLGETALGFGLIVLMIAFAEWVFGVMTSQDRAIITPWLGFWVLLTAAFSIEALSGAQLLPYSVPPLGSGVLVAAALLGLILTLRRSGPFPLQGELPVAAWQETADAVLLVDGAQRVQMATKAALDLLGKNLLQIRGKRLQRILPNAPEQGNAWEPPVWLADKARPDGGLWLHAAEMHAHTEGSIARVLFLRGGNSLPPRDVHESRNQAGEGRWVQGVAVRPALESVLRRYGMGRQFLGASVHVDYDWERVQQEHGDIVVNELLEAIAERLQQVCDWSVDTFRLESGQFVLVLSDLTGIEEVDALAARAQESLSAPFTRGGKRWVLRMSLALVPDLRLYRSVDEWLGDAAKALQSSRGEIVTTRPAAEQRNKLQLALEQSLLHDGIDWWGEPVLNLTTQQVAAWRLRPRWAPEEGVCWQGSELMLAVAGLHMQQRLYELAASQPALWPQILWLPLQLEDVKLARRGLGAQANSVVLEVNRLQSEVLHAQGLRLESSSLVFSAPLQSGQAFVSKITPTVIRLDDPLVQPGLADDLARQSLLRGCRAAARVREQRLYARGVTNHADLKVLRELGVDYVSGPVVGEFMPLAAATRFQYRPLRKAEPGRISI